MRAIISGCWALCIVLENDVCLSCEMLSRCWSVVVVIERLRLMVRGGWKVRQHVTGPLHCGFLTPMPNEIATDCQFPQVQLHSMSQSTVTQLRVGQAHDIANATGTTFGPSVAITDNTTALSEAAVRDRGGGGVHSARSTNRAPVLVAAPISFRCNLMIGGARLPKGDMGHGTMPHCGVVG